MGREDPLEKEMVTHPSTLAWKIPWMEEPCRLQSMGSQRVGHDWANGTPLQYSCLENPMDGGAWWAAVYGVTQSRTRLKRLSSSSSTAISLSLCQKQGTHRCVGLFLGFLSCSIGLYFCFCASTILSWWLQLYIIIWSQKGGFLQLHSSFSRLLWLFKVFCVSICIVKFFVLVLWKIPLVIW